MRKRTWIAAALMAIAITTPTMFAQVKLHTANPVAISSDYYGKDIALWGEGLGSVDQIEWNGTLYSANDFSFSYEPANELVIQIPTRITLPLGEVKIRLYDSTNAVYSNQIRIIVDRATEFPTIPLEGSSLTVIDHIWGPWGGEEAVLKQGDIYAFTSLFDMPTSKYKPGANSEWGLPLMGFQVCSTALITDANDFIVQVPGDGQLQPNGWKWEGCPNFPQFTNNWWSEIYPPDSLAAGNYKIELRSILDGRTSNARTLTVLPATTPPFMISMDNAVAVEGYTSNFPVVNILGYHLDQVTNVVITGPSTQTVTFTPATANMGYFSLPTGLPVGEYTVRLADASGPVSNRRTFRVLQNKQHTDLPGVTTFVDADFNGKMYVRGGYEDRWVVPSVVPFEKDATGKASPLFWKENVSYVFYNGQRVDNHTLINPDKGTVEIKGFSPKDWPLGRTTPGTLFNHGYHHMLNIFPQGGNWQSKVKFMFRSLYYVPETSNPNSFDYWDIWSYWNEQQITPEGNWPHFEVVMRDDYYQDNIAIVVTNPGFAGMLADSLGDVKFDLKFVYDFVGKREAAIYVKVHGKDTDYVDRTYNWSRKVAKDDDRIDLTPIVNGGFDFGTEKRHPHRILEPSQTAKSGAGATIDGVRITDQGFEGLVAPTITITPSGGQFADLRQVTFDVEVDGDRDLIDFSAAQISYTLDTGSARFSASLMYPRIFFMSTTQNGTKEGYRYSVRTSTSLPKGNYQVRVSGVRYRGTWAPAQTVSFTVN